MIKKIILQKVIDKYSGREGSPGRAVFYVGAHAYHMIVTASEGGPRLTLTSRAGKVMRTWNYDGTDKFLSEIDIEINVYRQACDIAAKKRRESKFDKEPMDFLKLIRVWLNEEGIVHSTQTDKGKRYIRIPGRITVVYIWIDPKETSRIRIRFNAWNHGVNYLVRGVLEDPDNLTINGLKRIIKHLITDVETLIKDTLELS